MTKSKDSLILCFLVFDLIIEIIATNKPTIIRAIEKDGFHRELITEIRIPQIDNKKVTSISKKCHVLLHEVLPSSVYVDIYQIQQMQEFGGPQVLTDIEIDIEKPEYTSPPHTTVYVFGKLLFNNSATWWTRIVLPIHLRYHRPVSGISQSAAFNLHNPHILVRCKGFDSEFISSQREAPCNSNNTSICNWNIIEYNTDPELLTVTVVIGNTDDLPMVMTATIGVTVGCCLLLIWLMFKLNQKYKHKRE